MNKSKPKWRVYSLVKNGECVYVGCSCSMIDRLKNHKYTKDFDCHIVISSHKNKKEALLAEKSIIKFLSIFGGDAILNAKYNCLKITAMSKHELIINENNY